MAQTLKMIVLMGSLKGSLRPTKSQCTFIKNILPFLQRVRKGLPLLAQGQTTLSAHILRVEPNLYDLVS
jgi:hypothetical protein